MSRGLGDVYKRQPLVCFRSAHVRQPVFVVFPLVCFRSARVRQPVFVVFPLVCFRSAYVRRAVILFVVFPPVCSVKSAHVGQPALVVFPQVCLQSLMPFGGVFMDSFFFSPLALRLAQSRCLKRAAVVQ